MKDQSSAAGEEGPSAGGMLAGLALAGAFGLLLWAEHRRALRRRTEDHGERFVRNLAVAGVAAAAVQPSYSIRYTAVNAPVRCSPALQ